MKRRDIVIGIVLLAVLVGALYLRNRNRTPEEMVVPETLSSIEEQMEDRFKVDIPEDVDKAELKALEGKDGSAIATRNFEDGKFAHEVLADLPEPENGSFYEGWLVKGEEGDEDFSLVSTGKMRIAKGGWVLDFSSSTDYSDHNKVMISLEKTADNSPEEPFLEGSF
jgi:hypothetical protein